MKLNNKGFTTSIVLLGLLVLFLLMASLLMVTITNSVRLKIILKDNINIPNSSNDYLVKASNYSSNYLNGPVSKSQIESITFEKNNIVPYDSLGSFDVSSRQNKSIMAWYKDIDNDSLYELYIGQKGRVNANEDSSYLFYNLPNLTNINLDNLDLTNVINMDYMFSNDTNLTTTILISSDRLKNYNNIFYESSTNKTAKIIVNYTSDTSKLIDDMINTKSLISNIEKGKEISY